MAVSIMRANPKEATFDKFLRRIGGVADIANSGIGAYSNIKGIQEKNRLAEAAKIKAEDDAQGIYGQKELDALMIDEAKEGDAGARKFKVKGPDGTVNEVYRRKIDKLKEKSADEIALTKAETAYKLAQAKQLGAEGNSTSAKSLWNSIPKPDQDIVTELSKKNAGKISIKNQIDAVMSNWDNLNDDEKVSQGRQLIKTLNSTEGADAVGVDEARRLGGKLEFAMGNLFNSNPIQFGRDLKGFKEQANLTSEAIGKAVNSNQEQVREIAGPAAGKGLSRLIMESEPKDPEFVTISNGKETIQVRKDKLADAEAEGYKQIGGSPTVMARP